MSQQRRLYSACLYIGLQQLINKTNLFIASHCCVRSSVDSQIACRWNLYSITPESKFGVMAAKDLALPS